MLLPLLGAFLPVACSPHVLLLHHLLIVIVFVGIHAISIVSSSFSSPSTRARGSEPETILTRGSGEDAPPQHECFRPHRLECGHGCLWKRWELGSLLLLLLHTTVKPVMMELCAQWSRYGIPKLTMHPRRASLSRLEFLSRAPNDVDGSRRCAAVTQR